MRKALLTVFLNSMFLCFGAEFDIGHLREYPDLNTLQASCVEHSKKLKGVKKCCFLARVFRDLYSDKIACEKFGKQGIYGNLLAYIAEAIKRGDVRTLRLFAHDNPEIEVPVRAMILLLDRTNNSCYVLNESLKSTYPDQYGEKVRELFGKEVTLAQGTIEDDRGHFRESSAVLEFTPETIARLKIFLENYPAEGNLKRILSSALDAWGEVCEKEDCSKVYREIYCMTFKGFEI